MATKNTKFKAFEITKEDSKKIKGGYADTGIGGGGTGSNGFIVWDDVDPRDDGFAFSTATIAAQVMKFKK